jgi:hypothetical protein
VNDFCSLVFSPSGPTAEPWSNADAWLPFGLIPSLLVELNRNRWDETPIRVLWRAEFTLY